MNPSQALHVAWYKTFCPNCHGDHSLKRSGGQWTVRSVIGEAPALSPCESSTPWGLSQVSGQKHTFRETNLRNWESMHVCSPGAWWDSSCECCAAVDVYRLSREDGLRRWGSRVVLSAKDWIKSKDWSFALGWVMNSWDKSQYR